MNRNKRIFVPLPTPLDEAVAAIVIVKELYETGGRKMKMIRAFIRPEKEQEVVQALEGAGFPSLTKMPVFGRGKQKGLQVGPVHYDELPKMLVMMVVNDSDVDRVVNLMMDKSRTGFVGDGKIFISAVEAAYTVRTGEAAL
jgi:nitrogen regulatory protein PII 1